MGRVVLIGWFLMMSLSTTSSLADESALPRVEPPGWDSLPAWQALRFEASKLFITASMEVRLEPLSGNAQDALLDSPEGRLLQVPEHPLWAVELTSSAAGRRSRSRVLFDPQNQAAFQRSKAKLGSKPYDKVSRFTHDGVYTRRRAPLDESEKAGPAEGWGKIQTSFESYPEALKTSDHCRAVLEPSQLLYLLGTLDLAQPPKDYCIFSDGSISRLLFEPRGKTPVKIDLEETSADRTQQRKETVDAHCVVIRSQTLDGQPGGELELLGLEGDVEIFLDTSKGLPLEVRGKLPHLGKVRVALVGVDFG